MNRFLVKGKASVIVGGQFGSEGKGSVAAYLALRNHVHPSDPVVCTTNAGAQAGHTSVLPDGTKFVCYHLPTMGVIMRRSVIYLNAGSIIDLARFEQEIIDVCAATGQDETDFRRRIIVHPNAAVILPDDQLRDKDTNSRIGSTGKGVGPALVRKIMRYQDAIAANYRPWFEGKGVRVERLDLPSILCTTDAYVTVEIPQGTGLSINGPFYPYATSRECWVGQGLTDAGIPPGFLGHVAMVCRAYPIRVASPEGGTSGSFWHDSREMDWSEFKGVEPELTTVTRRVRRIASWSNLQFKHAVTLNRPDAIFLTFCDYFTAVDDLHGMERLVTGMATACSRARLDPPTLYTAWGPSTDSIQRWGVLEASE